MKNKLTKQEKERLGNKSVFFSSAVISYTFIILFIQRMVSSSLTVSGALSLIAILRWVSLCGAMAFAAWSAYKEKKGFFLYCAMCIYVFFSATVLQFINASRAFPINYASLLAAFVMGHIYYYLKLRGKFTGLVKKIFIAVCFVIVVAFAVVCLISAKDILSLMATSPNLK